MNIISIVQYVYKNSNQHLLLISYYVYVLKDHVVVILKCLESSILYTGVVNVLTDMANY